MVEAGAYTPRLVEPSTGELRLLSPAAFRLWRALVRIRIEETEWFSVDLDSARRRAKIRSLGAAYNVLAELKRAGLVATSRNSETRWVRNGEHFEQVQAYTTNSYLVVGTCQYDRGMYKVRFPAKQWAEYVAACRWGATRARARVAAWRYEIDRTQWQKEWSKELLTNRCGGSSVKTRDLAQKSMRSVTHKVTNSSLTEASEKALRDLFLSSVEGHENDHCELGFNPPLPRPHKIPHRPVDPIPKVHANIQWMSTDLVPEQKAHFVIIGYRAAVEKVYGIKWWHYWKGDLKNAKHYSKFVACGEAMAEKGVPAEHWAIWRLTWMKANIKAFASKPPPVWMVMSAKQVSEKSGWFRKDYELPLPVYTGDLVRQEQIWRNEEARLFARGHKNPWSCLPKWYGEKRAAEIEAGHVSPFECWPDRHGSKWQAGPL